MGTTDVLITLNSLLPAHTHVLFSTHIYYLENSSDTSISSSLYLLDAHVPDTQYGHVLSITLSSTIHCASVVHGVFVQHDPVN